MTHLFTIFDTALGPCALAWRGDAIDRVLLPERDTRGLRVRMMRLAPDAAESVPDAAIDGAIRRITALVGGERVDLSDLPVALEGLPPFDRQVLDLARAIPHGRTRTYGEIATDLGDRLLAQKVGGALGRNPVPIIIPCHRVVAAGGRTGGFSAPGGVRTKLRLLAVECARIGDAPSLFDAL